jgi:hypothetical protein
MRLDRFCLVGKQRSGHRVIVWRGVCKLLFLSLLLGIPAASAIYWLVVERWSPLAPLMGAAAGVVTTLAALLINLFTPRRYLPTVGSPWKGPKI